VTESLTAAQSMQEVRAEFPILAHSTYLVSHSMGAAPLRARRELERYWNEWAADGPEAWERWLPEIGEIADRIGVLIGAPVGTLFLGPNVSVLQAAIATCLDFRNERNEVVYEALQFPSLTYVWREWERYGAHVVVVESDDGATVPTERIIAAITEKTAIAVISHAYYVSAALADVATIQKHCREVGALLCVDAYQTTGIYPYDVTSLDLDLVTGGSHKWLCGGPGCAWIYVKPALRDTFAPAVTGWMAHERPFAFEAAPIALARSMYRFGNGTPSIPGYIAAASGHAIIAALGVERIREHNVRLTNAIAEMALERGLRVNSPLDAQRRTGWIGIDFEDAAQVCRRLIAQRVFVDYRPGCGIRVGPHFYTTDAEIETFFRSLDTLRI
jgi:kynureninase